MTLLYEERLSDSPYVETITRGQTTGDGSTVRPAECHWHMVFSSYEGKMYPIFVGPLTSSGEVSWTEGAEILWVKFALGTFMPHLPAKDFLNTETVLPSAAGKSFWLKGSAWQFPNFENADTFVDRLVRNEVLVRDPVVNTVLEGKVQDIPSRTLRYRFLQATGQSQNHIHQYQRAQQAAELLQQGTSILDTVDECNYFDQPHLTRSLKRFVGRTPAQLLQSRSPM